MRNEKLDSTNEQGRRHVIIHESPSYKIFPHVKKFEKKCFKEK
jgi:hypothetical protein